ncbi:cell cycle protein [Paenibacillus alvei DSM 29]|nr:cell cycle protein [Paenibacillus alvei DSM 29]
MIIFLRKLSKIDKFTLVIVGCLIAIGTIAVYEATFQTKLHGIHVNNIVLFGVFCIPMLLLATIDYNLLVGKLSYVIYGLGILLLLLVMFKGENINGAVRWLSIGSFQLQPSEMMKIATVLLAAHLLQKRGGEQLRLLYDIVPFALVFLLPTVIIMKQPDLGTALVFIAVMLSMLWMGNVKALYMVICLSVIAIAVGTICWLYFADYELLAKLVKPHQMSRIQTFLDPTSDPDKSWHV